MLLKRVRINLCSVLLSEEWKPESMAAVSFPIQMKASLMSHTWTRSSHHKHFHHVHLIRRKIAFCLLICEMCNEPQRQKPSYTDLYSVLCRVCFVMEARMPTLPTTDLTAFCATCPSADEVTAALDPLGFTLVFQMKADDDQAYLHLAPLPAQFHYRDHCGTEVIYLAGVDSEDEQPAPRHASRFWLYGGADENAHKQTAQVLTTTWALTWGEHDAPALEAVA